ncbi:ATP-binding protein [Magnetococcus sp. PR-3]|uniref:ATP-binding protein n=1 Tax=Magnetococcus sp. PR-3 TaxID=3120355 RepID=UPI002FCE221E
MAFVHTAWKQIRQFKWSSYLLLFLLILVAIGTVFTFQLRQSQHQFDLNQIQKSAALLKQARDRLSVDLKDVQSDLMFLASHPLIQRMDTTPTPEASHIQALTQHFLAMSQLKGRYDQIRLINLHGDEVIRINYGYGDPVAVTKNTLQSKKHRYYFTESIALNAGQIFISPLDLNIEHKQVEVPFKPMLRLATPIFNRQGDKLGVIILNYLGKHSLDALRNLTTDYRGHLLMLNEQGYYLLGFRREQEWAFMFSEHNGDNFAWHNPRSWHIIQTHERNFVERPEGHYEFTTLSLPKMVGNQQGVCQSCRWKLIAYSPNHLRDEHTMRMFKRLLPFYAITTTLAALLLLLLLLNRQKRARWQQEAESLNRAIRAERDLFIGGPCVIFKWRNSYGWPVEYVSENLTEVLGYHTKHFLQGESSYTGIVVPEYLSRVTREIKQATQQKRDWFEHEPYEVVNAQGKRRWIRDITTLLRNGTGDITHYYGYIIDITDQKLAEQKLEQAHQDIQTVIDTLADATMVVNVDDYRVTMLNQAAQKLYSRQGQVAIGEVTCHELTHRVKYPCDGINDPCTLQAVIEQRKTVRLVHNHQDTAGRPFFVEITASPIFNAAGDVIQIVESQRDITQRMALEQALREAKRSAEDASRAKSAFLATMSHDIRTPMNAVLGMAELLLESDLDTEQHYHVKTINRAGEALLALINDVLDLSKIEAGEMSLEQISFDLHRLIQGTLDILRIKAEEKNLTLTCDISSEVPQYVEGDPERIRQVLLNLLGNALKFTQQGSIIVTLSTLPDGRIRFEVVDSGIGIAEDKLVTIFQPFSQAEAATARKFGGTGLGLSICQRLVDAMHGEISVESEPEKGSTFYFILPLNLAQKPQHHAHGQAQISQHDQTVLPMHILVVDDAADNRRLLRAFLKKTPHQLKEATGGDKALQMVKDQHFDLVLMDVQMPGSMDGYETTEAIRQWEQEQKLACLPVIILTAHAMREDIERSKQAGSQMHLTKPIRKIQLLEAIQQFQPREA